MNLGLVKIACRIVQKVLNEPFLHHSRELSRVDVTLVVAHIPTRFIPFDPVLDSPLGLAVDDGNLRNGQPHMIAGIKSVQASILACVRMKNGVKDRIEVVLGRD